MVSTKSQKITMMGLLLAVGIVLPFATAHAFGIPGTILLPMHIPVLLCGFLCGPLYGVSLGMILPLISSLLTGMPVIYPMAPIMTAELAMYGLVTGILYHKTKFSAWKYGIYPILLLAMVCGRVMYGLTFYLLFAINGSLKAPTVWTAIITGIPGIIIQLIFVPMIVKAVHIYPEYKEKKAVSSAIHQIDEEKAVCLIIQNGKIVASETGRGVAPIIKLYESGILENSYVVDKVVGKAAAMVMTKGGIKACHAVTVSRPALSWFEAHGVMVEYDVLVDHIINRTGDGMCPMEQTVLEIEDDKEVITVLKEKIKELSGK